ncbi:MAG: alpha/beta hydrolase [Candidatus Marsarchaeota archaeon]|nr:alpha/beta hydrolase [Candidatus Marsarchaeota archaeon]
MSRAVIVHGWGGDSESDWIPWLKSELAKRGVDASAPDMPNPNAPKMEEWIPALQGAAGSATRDLFLIGHSIGCQTILRYLEALPEGTKVGGVVLVAGWTTLAGLSDDEKPIAEPWTSTPIDWQKVVSHAESFVAIYSDNDPVVPESNAQLFREKLNAKLVLDSGRGHFTEDEDDITELPSVLDETLVLMGLPVETTFI